MVGSDALGCAGRDRKDSSLCGQSKEAMPGSKQGSCPGSKGRRQ
jgi:hypothetical protein